MAADGKTPPTHPQGGAGTLCVHVVSLCADTKTMTCRPCWDTYILTYQQTDRQTHRHTYINQYKHIVIPIHGCICVTYPPFGGGGGGEPGGAGSYIYSLYPYFQLHPCFRVKNHLGFSRLSIVLRGSWIYSVSPHRPVSLDATREKVGGFRREFGMHANDGHIKLQGRVVLALQNGQVEQVRSAILKTDWHK